MALIGRAIADHSRVGAPTPALSWLAALLGAAGLALLLAALPLELAVGLAVGAILVALALIEPVVALGALVAAVPLSTEVSVAAGDFSITAIEPLIMLLVVGWLARGLVRRDLVIDGGPLLLPLGLLLLALLAASQAAQRPGLAYKEMVKWLELTVVMLFTVVHLRDVARQRAILGVLFVAGTFEALFGIYQYASGGGPAAFTIGEALRAYGHFDQPNPFAGYLGTILPLALAQAARGHVSPERRLALLGGVTVVCTALAILLSLSRGAWVGVGIALTLMLVAWSPASRRLLAPLVGGLAIFVLLTATNILPGGWSDRLVTVAENFGIFDVRTVQVTSENFAVVERMAHWQAGWDMLIDHPILGVGPGNYPIVYEEYFLPGWREPLGHAHNYYLNMAAEAGLVGAAALLLVLAATYRTALVGLGRTRDRSEPARRALQIGLLGSLIVLTVHNLFDNLLVHGMQVQVGLLLGLVVVTARETAEPGAAPVPVAPGGVER